MWKNRSFYVVVDMAAILLAYILALLVRYGTLRSMGWLAVIWIPFLAIVLAYFLVAFFHQPSEEFLKRNYAAELKVVLYRNFYMILFLALLIFSATPFLWTVFFIQLSSDVFIQNDIKKHFADLLPETEKQEKTFGLCKRVQCIESTL